MKELFKLSEESKKESVSVSQNMPLAARMRPQNVEEFIGQKHLLGEGKVLRKIIERDDIPSLILYGPPGCGKTAFAMLVSKYTSNNFQHLNAVTSTVSDVREIISQARKYNSYYNKKTILFLDEIAHFNKTQQDALMKDVEEGVIILIGATTHNPFFSINTPILSRAMVFQFFPLSDEEIKTILKNGLLNKEKGLGGLSLGISDEALNFISKNSQGDARRALNILEISTKIVAKNGERKNLIDLNTVQEVAQGGYVVYDRKDDQHYDTISAFIKSMRGSDPDSAIYWLAKMIVAGEDPRFIARRILICAAEDIGNADPQALLIAESSYRAVEVIGMPESRIILAQAVIYISTAPKSNSSYTAIDKAITEVKEEKIEKTPLHLQSSGYKGADSLGKGKGYLNPHDFPGYYVPQQYSLNIKKFYTPSDSGYEKRIKLFLNQIEKLKIEYEKQDKKENDIGKKPS